MAEYIEREALEDSFRRTCDDVKTIYNSLKYDEERRICSAEFCTWVECLMRVKEAPTADVAEVRHGEWIPILAINGHTYYDCSVCGRQVDTIRKQNPTKIFPYCHCGAKMDGKGDRDG